MKIAIMQTYFLPYIRYFQLINAIDVYCNNVKQWSLAGTLEHRFLDEIVYLPLDQRCDEIDSNKIIKTIFNV